MLKAVSVGINEDEQEIIILEFTEGNLVAELPIGENSVEAIEILKNIIDLTREIVTGIPPETATKH